LDADTRNVERPTKIHGVGEVAVDLCAVWAEQITAAEHDGVHEVDLVGADPPEVPWPVDAGEERQVRPLSEPVLVDAYVELIAVVSTRQRAGDSNAGLQESAEFVLELFPRRRFDSG